MKIWVLIALLHYGTPEQKEVEVAKDLSWADCILLSGQFLRAFTPPVAATCKPADKRA